MTFSKIKLLKMKSFKLISIVMMLSLNGLAINELEAKSSPYKKESSSKKRMISKGEAIAIVKRQLQGKILSAKLLRSQGPPVYRVKVLLAKGRVRSVLVDAANGRVLRIR